MFNLLPLNFYQKNREFQSLRWRLLLSFLFTMLGISAITDTLVYQFFSKSLYQQVDKRLDILTNSAAHSWKDIKSNPQVIINKVKRQLDNDDDLDLTWQSLRQPYQKIEWFNLDKKLLGQAGKLSIISQLQLGFKTEYQQVPIRLLTIPVYDNQGRKQGYIRASESTKEVQTILNQLRFGFIFAEIVALGLIGVGGMWLTRRFMLPIEKTYQQLQQFTGDASHELRSPLSAIKTSVEVLQTHPERIHPLDVAKLKNIVSATNQMSHLIEDLLLLARIDNNLENTQKNWICFPLDELLEDVITFLEFKAEEKNIKIKYYLTNNIFIQGNTEQLHRLFLNLLDNAIKYTPNNGQVSVTLEKKDKCAVVTIEDNGIGISQENLSFIFDRFWREESARSPHIEGTGLGLAIVKSIIQQHLGDITVKSVIGNGTSVSINLPLIYNKS